MALNFPSSPVLGQTLTFGSKTWRFNSTGWQIVTDPSAGILTTKGDLLTFGTSNVRKGTVADSRVLLSDSSQADGLVWTPFSGRNAIINGDFNVWQRGTSFVSVVDSAYCADRWTYIKASSVAVHDVSRSTDVPSVALAGRLYNYSMLVDCQTLDASVGASDLIAMVHRIEGYNWLPLAQRNITLSFLVKATKTGVYCAALRNSGNDRSFVGEYTVNASDVWEKKSISITASPSAGTWDYTTGTGAALSFALIAGSNWQGTNNTWNSANNLATVNQVNACDSISNNFRIVGVQLEAGSVATEFETLPYTMQLDRCKRYCLRRSAVGANNELGIPGYGYGTNTQQDWIDRFDVEMRAAPSFSRSADADFYLVIGGSTVTAVAIALAKTDKWGAFLVTNNTTVASGLGGSLHNQNTSAWIQYDAEL